MNNLAKSDLLNSPRIIDGLSQEEYRAMDGISSSALKELAKSPAHFHEYITNPPEPTPEMILGTAFHTAVLEPEKFMAQYAVMPSVDRRTKAGKEAWENFQVENQGKTILSAEDNETIGKMVESLRRSKTAMALLSGGKAEQSVFWKCPVTGVTCKARPDYLIESKGIVVDVKTTNKEASEHGFMSSIGKYGYQIQSAFYLEGVGLCLNKPLTDFVHIVVEKKAPYNVGIYVLDDNSLAEASTEIMRLKDIYSECIKTGIYPGYPDEIKSISMPGYLFKGDS